MVYIHIGDEEVFIMMGASVKIEFQVANRAGLSLQEFLEAFPDIHLTAKQVNEIRNFLTAFCFVVLQEIDHSNDEEIDLTVYLRTLVRKNDQNEWFVSPLKGMKMFFRGWRVICCLLYTSPSPRD